MKLLLHACCAPCLAAPYKHLKEIYEITIFWYNPNIQPYREYLRRLRSLRKYASAVGAEVIYDYDYPLEKWLYVTSRLSMRSNVLRCRYCYADRLYRTAKTAKEMGFDAFSTTLLLAPYQKHEMIREIGESIEKNLGIKFHYQDMRGWFEESEDLAKKMGLYRQGYCGCIYSEADRYWKEEP